MKNMRNSDRGNDNNVFEHICILLENQIASCSMQDWPPQTLANSKLMSQGRGFAFRFDISPTGSLLCLDSQQLFRSYRESSGIQVF